uniref:hypothetical protein n=1 Tax=Catenulispora pinisilvae TaxID=2705253 RepID=UPI001892605B
VWESGEPSEEETDPGRDELCPVPLDELRPVLDGQAWLRDRRDVGVVTVRRPLTSSFGSSLVDGA